MCVDVPLNTHSIYHCLPSLPGASEKAASDFGLCGGFLKYSQLASDEYASIWQTRGQKMNSKLEIYIEKTVA